jgi:GT2 family glycosyltransferase
VTSRLPPDVARLLADRAAARAARNWAVADALRDQIRDQGWEPVDAESGSTARPILSPSASDLPSLLADEASVEASVLVVLDDHPDDLERLLRGLAADPPAATWELLIVANAPQAPVDPLLATSWPAGQSLPAATVLSSEGRLGWADAVNLGLRRSRGEVTILLDTSLEPTGDLVSPLLAAFEDPTVGIAGGWGVTSDDGREFGEAPPGEVDAVEGYCLAIRREALRKVGGLDAHFRFYRHADLDLSFAIRDAGWRAVRTGLLPAIRHAHRGWEAFPAVERDRLSKRNFYRFLKRWRDRSDLLLRPGSASRERKPG